MFSTFYAPVLFLHSWGRWIALVAAVGTVLAAIRRRDGAAERWGLIAMTALDVQMLLGLLLYFLVSPNMQEILAHFGARRASAGEKRQNASRETVEAAGDVRRGDCPDDRRDAVARTARRASALPDVRGRDPHPSSR